MPGHEERIGMEILSSQENICGKKCASTILAGSFYNALEVGGWITYLSSHRKTTPC
jgi:hypothetical protein